MVALAILAAALSTILQAQTRSIRMANQAKMLTAATLLAQQRMLEIEQDLVTQGFSEMEEEQSGDFREDGFERFRYEAKLEKIELPDTLNLEALLGKAEEDHPGAAGLGDKAKGLLGDSSSSTLSTAMTSARAAIAFQYNIIKNVLEQSIRRVTLRIVWKDGEVERDVTVTAYFTDPKKVDQAIQVNAAPDQTTTTTKTPTTTTTKTPTTTTTKTPTLIQ